MLRDENKGALAEFLLPSYPVAVVSPYGVAVEGVAAWMPL